MDTRRNSVTDTEGSSENGYNSETHFLDTGDLLDLINLVDHDHVGNRENEGYITGNRLYYTPVFDDPFDDQSDEQPYEDSSEGDLDEDLLRLLREDIDTPGRVWPPSFLDGSDVAISLRNGWLGGSIDIYNDVREAENTNNFGEDIPEEGFIETLSEASPFNMEMLDQLDEDPLMDAESLDGLEPIEFNEWEDARNDFPPLHLLDYFEPEQQLEIERIESLSYEAALTELQNTVGGYPWDSINTALIRGRLRYSTVRRNKLWEWDKLRLLQQQKEALDRLKESDIKESLKFLKLLEFTKDDPSVNNTLRNNSSVSIDSEEGERQDEEQMDLRLSLHRWDRAEEMQQEMQEEEQFDPGLLFYRWDRGELTGSEFDNSDGFRIHNNP
jgi:hypothetical protein